MKSALIAAGLAAAWVSSSPYAAEHVPLYREIKDWVVGCDNTRQCTAVSASEDMELAQWTVRITRKAGPEGKPRVALYTQQDVKGQPQLDGKPLRSALQKGDAESAEDWYATGAVALTLIDELRNGNRLTVAATQGEQVASLDGISAALLLMDAVQERVGTQSALMRRGAKPDSEVPSAPAAPVLPEFKPVGQPDEAEQKRIGDAVIAATLDTWKQDVDDMSKVETSVYALNEEKALVIIQTWCAAYNCAYVLYQAPREHPEQVKPLEMQVFPHGLGDEPNGAVGYDPDTGKLSSFNRARGFGDCGSEQFWRFDGERFQPLSLSGMGRCAGVESPYWPRMYRAADI